MSYLACFFWKPLFKIIILYPKGRLHGVSSVMVASHHPIASTTLNLVTPYRACAQNDYGFADLVGR